MVAKVARIVTAGLVLVVLSSVRPVVCYGWALWPFSDDNSASAAAKSNSPATRNVASTSGQAQPSALEKMGTGTKNFFTKVGDTVTFKKTPPKQDMNAPVYPKNPLAQEKDTSWWPSWLRKQKPEYKTVPEYLRGTQRPKL
jgi:hypothetical protein